MESKLYQASLTGDVQSLNSLLHQDQLILDRLSLTAFNDTPVHIAAMRGHHHFATTLLTHDPKLATALDSQRRTPLHLASANGNLEIVQELVRIGGSDACCFRDQDGLTPLHFAAIKEHLGVVKALVHANVDAAKEISSATGETILHMCVSRNCIESFKVLMELWTEEDLAKMIDNAGNTLLHAAAINKQTQILKYLLNIPSIKANGNAVNRNGLTALDIMDQCPRDLKSLETREILMDAGVLKANDLRPLPKPLQLPMKSSQTKRNGLWARYVNNDNQWVEKQRGTLIVAGLVVAGLSFLSGINPPGGPGSAESDLDNFNQFVGYNSVTMITSLAVVLVLVSGLSLRNKFWMWLLTIGTLFAMVAMVASYWQSLSMMGPDGNVNVTTVWICLIWMLGCGIIALIHTIFFLVWVVMKMTKRNMPDQTSRKGNQDVGGV